MTNEERQCPMCGGELANQGEEKLCNVHLRYRYDGKAIIRYFKCKKCGREYEVLDPIEDERKGEYKEYWAENGD